jgi:acyl carrier protein
VTRDDIEAAVLKALADVAPEVSGQTLRGDVPLRAQVDMDSFDFLNFVVGLHAQLGVDVPETDYPKLASLDAAVAYLERKLG